MKRWLAVLLAGSVIVSAASALGQTEGVQRKQDFVKVWVSSGAEDGVYRKLFDTIRTASGITIRDEYYPKDELDGKLQVAPVVGDAPDMIIVDYLQMPAYYEAGLIEALDKYMPASLKSDLIPSVVAESTYQGKLISTAQFDAGMGLWANKAMLQKAGVRIPVSYKEAWSKAEFEDALKKLKASGVPYPIYIRQNKPSTLYFTYMPILASFGGDYIDRKTLHAKGVLDGPNTVAAYDYLTWLLKQGYLNGRCDYEDAFYGKKESALALIGHWKYTDHVKNLGDDAIIIPPPNFGKGVFTCSGSTVWAMTTAAKQNGIADDVWRILQMSLEPANIRIVTDFNGAIPSRKSVMDQVAALQKGGRLYLYREQLEAGISVLRPLTPAHMTIYTAMQAATGDIIHGADAKTTLTAAAKEIDAVIKENGWDK
ncbi:extracellular solute-binding protein [Treponema socranskii]|uniref:sugar ABC transporter substrate-binding protein n=1 Tax=Treponema socranskii TaxID=53419 RepID=UPI003D8DA7D1